MAVNITIGNGNLASAAASADGVVGLVVTGITDAGGYTAGTPILVTSMVDVATAGITVGSNPFAWKQLNEFYEQAPVGAQLYVMLVAATQTVAAMALNTNAAGVVKLLNYAQGAIRVVGLVSDDAAIAVATSTATTITNGMNALVYTAAGNLLTTINAYVSAQTPLRGVIGGTSYANVPGNLTAINSGTTNNRVGILIGDTVSGLGAAVGLLLGSIAALPVQRKISRVKNGPLPINVAYIGTAAVTLTMGDKATIAGKGFITFQMYPLESGVYWYSDPMATVATDDFAMLARGRVIDKAQILIYGVMIQEQDDEVPVNADGTIQRGYATWLQQQIVNAITANMIGPGNADSVTAFVDPAQNVLSTSTLTANVVVTPNGYAVTIDVNLGL